MTGWPLAPLRRVRALEAREAARAMGEALAVEARAALEVARRLRASEAASSRAGGAGPVQAAWLAGAAGCEGRHAAGLLLARAAALRATEAAERRRIDLLAARAADRLVHQLEGCWLEARRRERRRGEEAAADELARPPAGRSRRDGRAWRRP